jgi:uncharacterized membrane protein YqgA involved in biofilm formation
VVNALSIIIGSLIGLFFKGRIPEKYSKTIMHGIGLAVVLIGIKTALKTDAILMIIISLSVGSFIGELLRIEEKLDQLGNWIGRRLSNDSAGISKGFVSASLLYCVGAMAIIGSMESGLTGNHQTLFAKSILDGIGSILFASTLGIGVLFSAVSVFIYLRCLRFYLSRYACINRIFDQTFFVARGGFANVRRRRVAHFCDRNWPVGD